ncbi:MAG: DUF1573 domain-containing protein [Bacteroidales bacterium]|jgi:hypothetical protein|nr:DUF1573 domain-containing protein [Bacteroidales bacterium]
MKKTLYILVLTCIPFFGFAQWGDPENNSVSSDELQSTRTARAQWTAEVLDVGTTKQNKPVQAKFEITNIGNAPLIISNVNPACDCTAPEWPKTPIMPGQKAYIILEYDAESAGKFQKGAIVTMNTNPSQYNIVMKGIVQK